MVARRDEEISSVGRAGCSASCCRSGEHLCREGSPRPARSNARASARHGLAVRVRALRNHRVVRQAAGAPSRSHQRHQQRSPTHEPSLAMSELPFADPDLLPTASETIEGGRTTNGLRVLYVAYARAWRNGSRGSFRCCWMKIRGGSSPPARTSNSRGFQDS